MGNRTGSPPPQYDDEETDSQSPPDETQQTGITDTTQPEPVEEEKPPSDEPDETEAADEPQGGGGGGVAPVDVPTETERDEQPINTDEEDGKVEGEPESEGETESGEQDDTDKDEFEFVYGDIVQDREEDLPEEEEPVDLVVVNLRDETISEWKCDDDKTVAEYNPGYPPTDNVVITVEMKILDEVMPEWDEREEEIPHEILDDKDINHDCYPSLRLELEEPSHLRPL